MIPLTPREMPAPFGRYSHGVAVPRGVRFVFTSGQLGLDIHGYCPEDAYGQARQCFANCGAILRSAGMNASDVVRINAFVTDRAYFADYMRARDEFCAGLTALPASTLLMVSGFTRPEFKVEVEITAAQPA